MNDPEITRKSPGNHPVITPFSRLITSTLLLLFTFAIGNVWADTQTYSFASSSELDNFTYTAGDASDTWAVYTATQQKVSVRDGGFVQYKCAKSNKMATFVTKSSFENISNISFYIASSDKGKTQVKIEVSSKADFSSDVTEIVNATGGLSGLGISSPGNNTWYSVSQSVESKSGYVRFTMTASSRGKYWSFDDIVITYTPSSGGDPVCPSGLTISSKDNKTAFYTGDAIELTAALSEGNGAITYQWYKGGTEEANKLTGKTAAKLEIASCAEGDAGDYYCVASKSGCSPAAVNADAFTITVTPSPCVTVRGAEQFVADYTINGAYAINSGCATSNGALKIDNGADYVEIYAPAGKKISRIEMSLYAGDSRKVGYGFGASAVVDNDLTPWDWADKDVTGSYADYEFKPISSGKAKYFRLYRKVTVDKDYGSGTSTFINKICVTLENTVAYAITYNLNGGTGTTPMESDKEAGTEVTLASGTSGITPPTDKKFNGWLVKDATDATVPVTDGKFTMPTSAVTIAAQWADVFAVTYAKGDEGASGEMTDSNSPYTEGAEVTLLANAFTPPTGKEFDAWVVTKTASGDPVPVTDGKFTMPAEAVTATATWKDACALDPTVSATTLGTTSYTTQVVNCAGISVLGSAGCTISEYGYVYGTSTAPTISDNKKALEGDYTVAATAFVETTLSGLAANTTYYVRAFATNSHGTAYGDEISFTTLAPLGNVLVLAVSADHTSDAITALRDNGFIVTVSAPNPSRDYTGYDLVVLDESLSGGNGVAGKEEGDIKGVNIPLLNLKSFFYTKTSRWNWGTPVNGTATNEIANISAAYCNAESHPIFAGLTITDGNIDLIDPAVASGNTLQGVTTNTLVEGKEGYTLATSGDGITFIHELTPDQRGVTDAKYLMVAISNKAKDNLSADGEKLIVNAAKYLIGSTSWTPIAVPTDPEIAGTTAYAAGETIELTASATGESAATTYTWYKGATLEAAKGAGAIQAAKTIAENGNVYSKAECVVGDAGTYWCVISNGTDCEANASVEITVSDASYEVSFESAHGTAPSAGSGISYTLPELTESGYVHQGWTANIDVTVDEAVVTAGTTIANGKVASFGADVKFTAVWKQIFAVTFNLNGQSGTIEPQDIIDGEKATKPADPVVIGQEFGGWFTDEECTAGNEFDFNTPIAAATLLYAKWTAFDGCTMLYPATSGAALSVGDIVDLQTGSKGGTIAIVGMKTDGSSIAYNARGLQMGGGSSDVISVTLNNDMAIDTKITVTLDAKAGGRPRGLYLLNGEGGNVKGGTLLGWPDDGSEDVPEGEVGTFSYTVEASDGLEGTNVFRLKRQNSTYIKYIKVEACGDAITFHNLTSAVNIAGKGTVTLGASSVREGRTTTAEYSAIDPLYEFVNWTVSGAGASVADATANPATITVGTEDAVVTLNLRLIPVKFTVEYYDGATLMGSEQVVVNEHPTASEIATAKRHYTFLGWSETDGGDVVALNTITRTEAGTVKLYAKYEAVVCPTSGTVYKFQLKTDLTNGNVFDTKPNSVAFTTDNYLSVLTGGILTGSIDDNNVNRLQFYDQKAIGFTSGTGGTLTIGLDCALAEGDVIKYINYASSGNKMTLSDATHTQTLDGNGTEEVQTWEVPAAWAGATELTLVRGGNTPKLTYFEIYRRPVATGATLADLTIRQGQSKTPVMTLMPSADARVTSQVWEIVGTPTNLTGAAIDPSTGAITTGTLDDPTSTGSISVKVTLNGSIEATCTATVVGNIDQQNVTKSTVWDWHNTGATANIQLTSSTDPKKNENFVLANVAVNNNDEFESDKLAVEGEHMVRDYDKTNPYFQGQLIQFHTTVAGVVRVKFAHTGTATAEKPARELYINGVATGDSRDNATPEWSNYIEVPAGDVSITAHYVNLSPVATQQYIRVFEIEFLAVGHERTLVVGDLGTVCLPKASIARGVTVYEYQGADEIGKIVFDELGANELLEAGKPYIFQVNETHARFYYNTDPAVGTPDNLTALKGNLGATITFDPGSPAAANVYFVKDHAFWMAKNTGVKIGQYRCYLQMDEVQPVSSPNPAPGRRRITLGVQGEQVATGFESVQGDNVQCTKVLINGELFILRGEKMYDAKGQLVK